MAYEIRQPANYSFGTLKSSLASGATSMASDDFVTKLTTGLTTEIYVPLTIQNPTTGVYEIVWVTSHSAASDTATVVRAREGTSQPSSWPAGSLWTCSPTLRDGQFPCTRDTLPSDPHIGMRCLLTDESRVVNWSNQIYWFADSNEYTARKSANESVTSSTTLQNDDHLVIPDLPNTTAFYELDGYLMFSGIASGTVGGIQIDFSTPSGAILEWTSFAANINSNASSDVVVQPTSPLGGPIAAPRAYGTNGAIIMSMNFKGYLITAGTGGAFQLRWAQAASSATATILRGASYFSLTQRP